MPNKVRIAVWLPHALADSVSKWVREHPQKNRTVFVNAVLVEKLQRHGIEIPPEAAQAAMGADDVTPKTILVGQLGIGKSRLAALMSADHPQKHDLSKYPVRGNRVFLTAWVDHRLVAGFELLLRQRPQMTRSSLLIEAILEKLRADGILAPEQTLELTYPRRALRPEAFEGVRVGGTTELAQKGDDDRAALDAGTLATLEQPLAKLLRSLPRNGFRKLCRRVLAEMGVERVLLNDTIGDGGIDGYGTVKLDSGEELEVSFQCKLTGARVTPAEISKYRAAIQGRVAKGMVLSVGEVSKQAIEEARTGGPPPIDIVAREDLVRFLVSRKLGVVTRTVYELDDQFFDELR